MEKIKQKMTTVQAYSTLSSSTIEVEEPDLQFSLSLLSFCKHLVRVLFAIAQR
jgi:hypothetical protein